jgi:hypothetical protein|tara:strand:- start:1062 stop:1646 length:585 start_codon:yes stop_codon:yes gene_type:complete
MAMMAPIPGQSLTDEPQNFAWERPPEYTDPDDAIVFHMDRLAEESVMESVLFLMEFGYPVDVLTRSMLTGAVGEGQHTIDVSLIIAPVIEAELVYMATTAGIDFKETFTEDKTDDDIQEEKLRTLILKKLDDNIGKGDKDFALETLDSVGSAGEDELQAMQDAAMTEPSMDEEMPSEEVPSPAPGEQGLMSRGV